MSALVLALSLLAAEPTGTPGPEIHWTGPAACADAGELLALAEAYAGGPLPPTAERARVEAVVASADADTLELKLALVIDGVASQDSIVARTCTALREVVALKLALALQPVAVVERVDPPRELHPAVELVAAVVRPDRGRARPRLAVRTEGILGHGTLPGLEWGVGLALALYGSGWRAEIAGAYYGPRTARPASGGTARGQLSMGTVTARGCGVPRLGPVELPLCLGLESGAIRATASGVSDPRVVHEPRLAVVVGTAVRVEVHPRIALRAGVEAVIALLVSRFSLDGLGRIHETGVTGVRGTLGLEFRAF